VSPAPRTGRRGLDLGTLQQAIARTFGARDRARGMDGTFRRLVEEIGEVANALRRGDRRALALELSDVLAWTVSVAVLGGVDLARVARRYGAGCPRCGTSPCRCPQDWTSAAARGDRRVSDSVGRAGAGTAPGGRAGRPATGRRGAASRARATRR